LLSSPRRSHPYSKIDGTSIRRLGSMAWRRLSTNWALKPIHISWPRLHPLTKTFPSDDWAALWKISSMPGKPLHSDHLPRKPNHSRQSAHRLNPLVPNWLRWKNETRNGNASSMAGRDWPLIPLAYIQNWTAHAPWPDMRQVEQDLIIFREI